VQRRVPRDDRSVQGRRSGQQAGGVERNSYVTARDLERYETTCDVRGWTPKGRRLPQFETYGEEYVSDTWFGWIDAFRKILDEHDGDV